MLDYCCCSQYWPHPFQRWCRHQKKKQGKENIHFGWWISFRKLVLFANQPWWLAINTLMISSPTPRARKSCLNNIFCICLICPITNRFIQKLGESSWSFWRFKLDPHFHLLTCWQVRWHGTMVLVKGPVDMIRSQHNLTGKAWTCGWFVNCIAMKPYLSTS